MVKVDRLGNTEEFNLFAALFWDLGIVFANTWPYITPLLYTQSMSLYGHSWFSSPPLSYLGIHIIYLWCTLRWVDLHQSMPNLVKLIKLGLQKTICFYINPFYCKNPKKGLRMCIMVKWVGANFFKISW